MTDQEKLAMVYQYIDERLAYLTRLINRHECNAGQLNTYEQTEHLMALVERRVLMNLSHMLMEVAP